MPPTLSELLTEYDRALRFTAMLTDGLDDDQVAWRPHEQFSPIGWHLAHQAAVAHFMLRNLTAAAPRLDPELEALADSATPETERAPLPPASGSRSCAPLWLRRCTPASTASTAATSVLPPSSGWSRPRWSRPSSTTSTSTARGSPRCAHATWASNHRPRPQPRCSRAIDGYPVLDPAQPPDARR